MRLHCEHSHVRDRFFSILHYTVHWMFAYEKFNCAINEKFCTREMCERAPVKNYRSNFIVRTELFCGWKCHCDFPSMRFILMEFSMKMKPPRHATWSLYRSGIKTNAKCSVHRVRNETWRWCWSKINVYEITTYFQIYRIILYFAVLYVQCSVLCILEKCAAWNGQFAIIKL